MLVSISTAAVALAPKIMEEEDVLPYLEKMMAWQRKAATLEVSPELPREQLLKNALVQHSAKALNDSFDLAQALAALLPPAPAPDVTEEKKENASKEIGIRRAIRLSEGRAQQLQTALSRARGAVERARLQGELRLEQEHLTLLKAVAETIGAPEEEEANDSLSRKISQLSATLPPPENDMKKVDVDVAAKTAKTANSTSGIVGIAARIYGFIRAKGEVKSLLSDTKGLLSDNKDRSQMIRDTVRDIMEAGKTARTTSTHKPKPGFVGPLPEVPTYDDLASNIKDLSKVAIALGTANKSLSTCLRDLSSWMELISDHIKELMSELAFRSTMLGLAVAVTLGLASLARKATRRYVTDRRRRDQLRIVRRVVLIIVLGIVLFLGFFTDLDSLATFAGLLTAGVAFAMKDMILSLIAYFQFFGSSDVRVGDDISIAGVTGKITHIGMLRFYMMETQKSDIGFLPTGRIVGFANSVLFQPTPFYRQTSGTNFVWNEIDVLLSPTIDHAVAYQKLNDIVQKAYAEQQKVIRLSEASLQKASTLKLEISVPQTYFKFTAAGVAFVIRYAVDREQAQQLHLLMMTELLSAMKKDPELRALHVSSPGPGAGQPVVS